MSVMQDTNGIHPSEARPSPRKNRVWVKPLLFLLFAVGFILTCPAPRKDFVLSITPDIIDQGAGWLFTLWAKVIGWWRPGHIASGGDYLVFQGAVIFLFSALMLLPEVPLIVTVGGQITLFSVWLVYREECLGHHEVEAWNVCLGAMFIAALGFWKGTRWDHFVAAAFGVALGYFPLMRQPAIQTPLACGFILGVLGLAAAANMFLRWRTQIEYQRDLKVFAMTGVENATYPVPANWSFLQYLRPLAVFFVCFFVMRSGAFWVWSITNNNATMKRHGAGHSLFSSLGFTQNAYNLTYSDDCWLTQGLLYEGRPWVDNDVQGQKKLEKLWRTRVLEDPGLLVRGAFAKSFYLIRYFTGTLNPRATQYDDYPIKPSWITLAMGIGFCVGAAWCIAIFYRWRNDRLLMLCAGTVGLGIASFAQLLIVVPFYLGTAIAYCVGMFFIFMPAVRHVAAAARADSTGLQPQRNTLVYQIVGILVLALVLLVSGFTACRFFINQTQARELLVGNPIQKLDELRFDFAFRFNRLSIGEQQQAIVRLLSAQSSQRMFRPLPHMASGPERIFTPVLAVMGDRFVCVTAKLSRDWKMLLPSRVMGPKNSVLLVVKNADRLGPTLQFLESPDKYLKIADGNWDGRYRMFVLPAPPDYAADAKFLGVSAFNFKDGEETEGVGLELISGDPLYRSDQMPP